MEKLKENKKTFILTSIITLLPIAAGLILWNKLPDKMATHFAANGEADGWSSKAFVVFGLPLIIFVCHLFSVLAASVDPRRQQITGKIFKLMLWICPLVTIFSSVSVYGYALGWKQNPSSIGILLIGAMFILIGNYLPKCRQNYSIGIKIPWTLHDEENWNHTHRFAGKLWILGGASLLVLFVFNSSNLWIALAIVFAMTLIPIVYSFLYYLKQQ